MKIKTTIEMDSRQNWYCIDAVDEATDTKIVISRAFDTRPEAELAEAILKYMFSTYETRAEFNFSEWDYNVKTVFRLLDTPNKW